MIHLLLLCLSQLMIGETGDMLLLLSCRCCPAQSITGDQWSSGVFRFIKREDRTWVQSQVLPLLRSCSAVAGQLGMVASCKIYFTQRVFWSFPINIRYMELPIIEKCLLQYKKSISNLSMKSEFIVFKCNVLALIL